MQKLPAIYTRSRMGIDNKVWLTFLVTVLLSAGLLGFRMATTEPCFDIRLSLKGVVDHPYAHNYFVGESIIFKAAMKQSRDVEWDFGDGSPAVKGAQVTHSFANEGNFLVTATVNGKCMQSVNIHISQMNIPGTAAATIQPADPNGIIGKDFASAGELAVFQTEAVAGSYEWVVVGNPAFGVKQGSKVSYSFTEPGTFVIKLKLDNDEAKVYRKTIVVSASPAAGGADIDELPPLPLPAPPPGNTPAEPGTDAAAAAPEKVPAAEKKVEIIPDPILRNQLQDVIDGKETLDNLAKYMCDGMNGKVKGNGKIYANLSLFGEELKGKKGMLGLGGKRKIRSVKANREAGSNCIFRLDVEYK